MTTFTELGADDLNALVPPNLTATLEYGQWRVVLGALSAGPYNQVRPVIEKLMEQLSPQADSQQAQAILAVVPAAADSRN